MREVTGSRWLGSAQVRVRSDQYRAKACTLKRLDGSVVATEELAAFPDVQRNDLLALVGDHIAAFDLSSISRRGT
jgi:hypothetical protein